MKPYRVISPATDLHGVPDVMATRGKNESQLVLGEVFLVDDITDGWAKGRCGYDDYAGYVDEDHLALIYDTDTPTHIVTALTTHSYMEADFKSPCDLNMSINSKIAIEEHGEKFSKIKSGGWIFNNHISPIGKPPEMDLADTAKRFLETPYYWGGRTAFGIDCSGLVQVCLELQEIQAPRDSEDQEKTIGKTVDKPSRNDIVFFKGHVGIMIDDTHMIHATAYHMKVIIEPLSDVTSRTDGITAIKRI